MKFWDKILSIGKVVGIVAGPIGAIWAVATFATNFKGDIQDDIKNYHQIVMDSISEIRDIIIDYQIETNTGLEMKTGQINEILEQLKSLNRNQKIIIRVSGESKQIIEEIQNQQLIDNTVDIEIVESKNAYIVQLKKKELEL